jgi:translocation protein SEC63
MSTPGPEANIGGDDAFIQFAFTIVSVVAFVMYLPLIIAFVKAVIKRLTGGSAERRRSTDQTDDEPDFFQQTYETLMSIPRKIAFVMATPGYLGQAFGMLLKYKVVTISIAIPRFVRWCFRPRYFIFFLWCFLFSLALYTNLSFDAYAALGLARDASPEEIRKTYRALTRKYHPDQNKTEEARIIYARVKKAYKALTDADTFEAEAGAQELSAGIALPTFLTSRNNSWIIMLVLIVSLIGVPYWLYRKFAGNDFEKIQGWIARLLVLEEQLIPLYADLGVPVEKKFLARQAEIETYKMMLSACSIPVQNPSFLETLPPLAEFGKKLQDPEKFRSYFAGMGLNDNFVVALAKYAQNNPDLFQPESTAQEQTSITPVSPAKFEAVMMMYELIVGKSHQVLDEFDNLTRGSVKALYVIRKHHYQMMELLQWAHQGKISSRDVTTLIEAPRVGRANVLDIAPSIQQLIVKNQKEQMKQQQKMMGMKHGRL